MTDERENTRKLEMPTLKELWQSRVFPAAVLVTIVAAIALWGVWYREHHGLPLDIAGRFCRSGDEYITCLRDWLAIVGGFGAILAAAYTVVLVQKQIRHAEDSSAAANARAEQGFLAVIASDNRPLRDWLAELRAYIESWHWMIKAEDQPFRQTQSVNAQIGTFMQGAKTRKGAAFAQLNRASAFQVPHTAWESAVGSMRREARAVQSADRNLKPGAGPVSTAAFETARDDYLKKRERLLETCLLIEQCLERGIAPDALPPAGIARLRKFARAVPPISDAGGTRPGKG